MLGNFSQTYLCAYLLHPLWTQDDGCIPPKVNDSWLAYVKFVCPNVVKQNHMEDEFLLFVRKHNGFQIEISLLKDPIS
jgi:hypothetical protein